MAVSDSLSLWLSLTLCLSARPVSGRPRQVTSFKEQDDYEAELSDEVEKLLASCCEDSTAKPPADAVERLRRVASLPTGGVLAPWLAQRLGQGVRACLCTGLCLSLSL